MSGVRSVSGDLRSVCGVLKHAFLWSFREHPPARQALLQSLKAETATSGAVSAPVSRAAAELEAVANAADKLEAAA